jgi:3-methyladenine DNA glycosylase AlkD
MNQHAETLIQELNIRSIPRKAEWWNHYMKGEIRFVGTSIPEIRKLLKELNSSIGLRELPMNQQVGFVNGLMRSNLAEHKLAAILYLQLFWLGNQKNSFLLSMASDWYTDRLIYDWNTCDSLSVRVIAPILNSGEEAVICTLKQWNCDPYLWKARASLVPFAFAHHILIHRKNIERSSDLLIRREERFAKTAVGWVMREYSRVDEGFVLDFLSKHVKHTTWEVKRNALKYYRNKLKQP